MSNIENFRGGSHAPGGKIKEFFSWLRGLWAPKYVPQRSRYGEKRPKIPKDIFDATAVDNQKRRYDD